MNDFGFEPLSLPGLALVKGYSHKDGDMYDPTDPFFGNTNIKGCDGNTVKTDGSYEIPDWLYLKNLHTDLRMFYVKCSGGKLVH